ncbi:MAG TPA: 5-(carboxyamino)imidazole ribonucleotide synthase [Kiritimatiellia bacterium]|nr:5-(carboxyamino)imidazole ribonucleotide synthase [Kiritimatiellia bacterium]HMP35093.1 5-(carboxyamino)imidazole ribonucleotide synthase [Kiritimatiellia bacterium]
MDKPLQLGILGGGQLALMLAQAAAALPIRTSIMVKRLTDALPGLTGSAIEGDWDDPAVAAAFAGTVNVVTLENEFVAPAALAAIEGAGVLLRPGLATIRLIQDKWTQKEAMVRHGLPVVASRPVGQPGDLAAFAAEHGWPVVLKRRHFGYDGKGNATVRGPTDVAAAWEKLHVNAAGLYAEAFCPFVRELAVMVTRGADGACAVYPVADTVQRDHICHVVTAPSDLSPALAANAQDLARRAVESIDAVGTVGVEMFLTSDHRIVINELAPRVHNSGHYTIEGCVCSQFENHLRAVAGLPLGSTAMVAPYAAMVNLLGDGDGDGHPAGYEEAVRVPGAHLHLYGKARSTRGRKMGHVTALGTTREEALETAQRCAAALRFG